MWCVCGGGGGGDNGPIVAYREAPCRVNISGCQRSLLIENASRLARVWSYQRTNFLTALPLGLCWLN